jgi:DNA-binding response OmpR family regulator
VKLAGHIKRALVHDGHDPHLVHDGGVALNEARNETWDLILLDVELPTMNGLEVLRQLRADENATRVLMLTARGEVADRVAGLVSGADDYLVKPFAMKELLARINAVGRRVIAPTGGKLQVADLCLTLGEREVRRGERRISLSEREYSLLQVLMREPGRVFSRAELSERVWAREHDYDARLVEVYISRLRGKIDEEGDGPPLIQTLRHLGYKISAEEPSA